MFIKMMVGADPTSNLGVTLAAIGLGQMFPMLVFENFLMSKVLSLGSEYQHQSNGVTVKYVLRPSTRASDQIASIKNIMVLLFLVYIAIFMITVYMSTSGFSLWQPITLGAINCGISWSLIIYM